MGDRCYLTLTCKVEDAPRFHEAVGVSHDIWETEQEDLPDGIIIMSADQVNYAGYDQLHALAAEGLTFLGHHSEGGDYPGGIFAAMAGDIRWQDAWQGDAFVRVDAEGTVHADELAHVRGYYALEARVRTALGLDRVAPAI